MTPRKIQVALRLAALLCLAAAPAMGQPFLLADFEFGNVSDKIGGFWFTYADTLGTKIHTRSVGGSLDTSAIAEGYGGSMYSAQFGFTFGTRKPVYCDTMTNPSLCNFNYELGIGAILRTNGDTAAADFTGATSITFWSKAKAPMKVLFIIATNPVKDYAHYRQEISLTTEWKEYTVNLTPSAVFAQPTWGVRVPWTPSQVNTINWVVVKYGGYQDNLASDTLYLDDIKINNFKDPFTGIRRGQADAGMRLRRDGSGLRLTLADPRLGGWVRLDDLLGRSAARVAFRAGQQEVVVTPEQLRRGRGPLFLRVLPESR